MGQESTYNAGDQGLIPGLGRSPGGGKGYQLQYYVILSQLQSRLIETAGQCDWKLLWSLQYQVCQA